MAITSKILYSNIPAYPKSWYAASGNWSAKTVSVAADRYKLTSPTAMQIDVNSLSLTSEVATEPDLSLDATWDFGQSAVGTWTADTDYEVGDWVRATSNGSLWDGAYNGSNSKATPTKSSNTLPSGVASADTEYEATYAAWLGFNGLLTAYWCPTNTALPHWIGYDFGAGNSKVINKYRFMGHTGSSSSNPKTFKLQGSNDNSIWIDLDSRTLADYNAYTWTDYLTFSNNTSYRYYRLYITAVLGGGANYTAVAELQLIAAPGSFLYKCTSAGTALQSEPAWGTTIGGTTAESGGPTWTCYYDDTVASNRAGVDYFVYSCIGTSTVPDIVISRNSTIPEGYTDTTSRKIGGFHCLCASVGTIASHPLSGYLTGDILPTSVWDVKKRCKNIGYNNNGLAYIAELDSWVYIYLPSGSATAPVSVYNGTILDTVDWNTCVDAGRVVGMKLFRDGEFQVAAGLSNEQTNIYGSADPVTTGGHVDTAGRRMISKYGLEDCCGVMTQWLDEQSFVFTTATAHYHKIVTITGNAETDTSGNAVAVDGSTAQDIAPAWAWYNLPLDKWQLYMQGGTGDTKMCGGGNYGNSSSAGSRCRALDYHRWRTGSWCSFRLISPNVWR
jgi:hypothetical protein